jgi:hypothetical protein
MIFFDIESSVMPLIQRKTILKDFENHKSRYTIKYGFLIKFLYSFELIIQLHFLNVNFLYNYLQLIKFKFLKKNCLILPYDLCNIIYFATV